MSERDPLPEFDKLDDNEPRSALLALPAHLLQFVELVEMGHELKEAVEILFPGHYENPKDAGWRWYHRRDVQAAVAEIRAEAIRRAARGPADVLRGMWEVADRCMQRVRPVFNRKGEQVTTETAEGEPALAYEFDANGSMRALESLANYHGMTKQRTEISGPNGGPIETKNTTSLESKITPEQADRDYLEIIKRTKTG
jgi:hypothetical protein